MLAFLIAYAINIGSPHANLTWQAVEMSLNVTVGSVGLGINFVGLLLLAWYSRLKRANRGIIAPPDKEPRPDIVEPAPLPG